MDESPLKAWRKQRRMTQQLLPRAAAIDVRQLADAEAGKRALAGELQDYPAKQGENVSRIASDQSALIAHGRREGEGPR